MEPVKPRKLSAEVVSRLIQAISAGEYPAGSQLPSERELMLRLGVGRPAVREAMQKLEQMGLLRISHGERARVTNPTMDEILEQMSSAMVMLLNSSAHSLDDLKEARFLVESALVKRATARASRSDLERLEQIHSDLTASRGNAERFVELDMAFHAAIAEISGNHLFGAVVRGMLGWMSRFKRDMVSVKGADRITIEEHERIMKAIIAGDAELAAAAMAEHLMRANALYTTLLRTGKI